MGTLQGHLLPGCFFLVFAIWWTTQIARRLILCSRGNIPFYSTVTFPCPMHGRCVRWPLEGAVKVVATIVGMAGELFAATNYGAARSFVYMGDLQHVTMYAAFCLSGVVDIISAYDKAPTGLDYMASALAFIVQGLLFTFHLHGRSPLDVVLHQLLVAAVFACAIASVIELLLRHSVLPVLIRTFLVFLQGTWFIQVGFILYNPLRGAKAWDQGSHESIMIVVMLFCWHMIGVIIAMFILTALSKLLYTKCCIPTREDITYELLEDGEASESDTEDVVRQEDEEEFSLQEINTADTPVTPFQKDNHIDGHQEAPL